LKKKNNSLSIKKYFVFVVFLISSCTPLIKKTDAIKPTPKIRVLLNEIVQKDSIFFEGNYKLISEEAEYEFGSQNNKIYIVSSSNSLLIYNEFRYLEYQKTKNIRLVAASNESQFFYNGSTYSGDIIFVLSQDSSALIVNEVAIEDYLRGVVPAEIYAKELENFEAVKAQAICARTYAIIKMKNNKNNDFDIYHDTRDQVYKGMNVYNINSDKAINETRGLILTFQNKPAIIYYHSTCGGELEPVQNVFSDFPVDYLIGGMDAVGDVISCSASPKFRWNETRTIGQLDSSIQKIYGSNFLQGLEQIKDTVQINLDLRIINRSETGRVQKLQFNTADTSIILSNFQIRRFLGQPSGNPLPSNLFYLSQENDSTITIHGGGYGHGVGMCQWGAMNMSKRGFKYYHILSKYFPGTLLTKGY
jgi:stage II sporulation protein D